MVRKAEKADAGCIAEMAVMMWDSNSAEELAAEFEAMLENEECALFIYCIDHKPVGFAQCGLRHDYVEGTKDSPVGYLEGIFMREEYRKKGCARELLAQCESWAKQKGCAEFASDCELDNDGSFAFHMHMGFAEANRIICFVKQI
ncbi:MAG: GNAT family N-acetyltransferase [Muribaculaceae bacterium]|nr:GNAT family N-acetyltransferase [Roseburia sp.]MCM1431554.1 GNAT family N-acetyltransferase [Muribaculaceae bacterium]MCM1492019.1 GNAT family N-acetyltransferase [Muribaculaceae bacterium]